MVQPSAIDCKISRLPVAILSLPVSLLLLHELVSTSPLLLLLVRLLSNFSLVHFVTPDVTDEC